MTRRATKFRPHRGGFEEAMSEVVTVHSKKELRKHLLTLWEGMIDPNGLLSIEKYGYDDRNKWDTYIVSWNKSVVGFTSGPLN